MRQYFLSIRFVLGFTLGLILVISVSVASRVAEPNERAAQQAKTSDTGFAVKKPVLGGSCQQCPWGVIADVVKAAAKPYGYDVQICYTCGRGSESVRIVSGAKMPPALRPARDGAPTVPGPNGPVDFGVTDPVYLWWGYQGTHDFMGEDPKKNLRLIGVLQHPSYLIVAVKADSGITDLSDIKEKHLPARILTGVSNDYEEILAYYDLNKQSIEAVGGHVAAAMNPAERKNFDVLIIDGGLENVPEWNVLYEMSQKYDLKYLQLPDALLEKLARDFDTDQRNIPAGLLRGIDHPIATVTISGQAIYGRSDMPDDFAYTIAKALDEHQDLLEWTTLNVSYNPRTVWKAFGVPLHPGAEKYYKERGYIAK